MKDSFILYLEQKAIFDELDNEEAGMLIKAIFDYQSTGQTPNLDKSLKLAFIPIKNSLDRNESKWEETKKARSEAGKKHKGNQYTNGTKWNKTKQMEQVGTNGTVNDNVNVNVNEHVNVNVNEHVSVNDNKKNISASSSESDSKLFIELPLIDKTGYPIYEKDIETWKTIYPAVNIEQEIRNMFGWLDSNPKNRKTKSGIRRFINSWLSRSQNTARVDTNTTTTTQVIDRDPNDMSQMTDEEIVAYLKEMGI